MRIRHGLVIALFVLPSVALLGEGGAAGPDQSSLRADIARLRGEVAQLGSQLDFLNRRRADALPVGGGGLCADPCAADSDGDGVNDCEDLCPCDPSRADGDGDGIPDCADPCPDDATDACIDPCRMDSDGDGVGDCEDPCPYDPTGAAESDGDGIPDCQDPCAQDPTNQCDPCQLDQDGDGVPDCRDDCPWEAPVGGGITAPPVPCIPPPTVLR